MGLPSTLGFPETVGVDAVRTLLLSLKERLLAYIYMTCSGGCHSEWKMETVDEEVKGAEEGKSSLLCHFFGSKGHLWTWLLFEPGSLPTVLYGKFMRLHLGRRT